VVAPVAGQQKIRSCYRLSKFAELAECRLRAPELFALGAPGRSPTLPLGTVASIQGGQELGDLARPDILADDAPTDPS
jgi:hypothetical protein